MASPTHPSSPPLFFAQVTILKFNCNKANKELGVSLGIKVAPTFILYKNNEKVGGVASRVGGQQGAGLAGWRVRGLVATEFKVLPRTCVGDGRAPPLLRRWA